MYAQRGRGKDLIANLRFSNGGKNVSVSWYSTVKGKYYNSNSVYNFELQTVQRKQIKVSVQGNGGSVIPSSTVVSTQPIEVTIIPDAGYYLSKLTLDGEDVTSQVKNNVYILTETEGALSLVAEFSKIQSTVKVSNEEDKGSVVCLTEGSSYDVGEEVNYEITPKSGWKVESVTFNGQEVQANENGVYTITVAEGDNDIVVSYAKVATEIVPPENKPDNPSAGCGSVIPNLAFVSLTLLSATGCILLRKRKES